MCLTRNIKIQCNVIIVLLRLQTNIFWNTHSNKWQRHFPNVKKEECAVTCSGTVFIPKVFKIGHSFRSHTYKVKPHILPRSKRFLIKLCNGTVTNQSQHTVSFLISVALRSVRTSRVRKIRWSSQVYRCYRLGKCSGRLPSVEFWGGVI